MNIAFYTAASGMIAQQEGMNIYSNNISNINTNGFKAMRPSFADCVYTIQRATEPEWQTGHGQYVQKTDLMFTEGMFNETGQELDFAVTKQDFFMVRDERDNTFLTRNGNFNITQVDDHWELVNGDGEFVLDYEGNSIIVPFVEETSTRMDENGEEITETVQTDTIDYNALGDMIGVYTVDNVYGLDNADGNHFAATARSGDPAPNYDGEKIRQVLEMSTVDLATDMVHIIESQRSYQLNARIVQTADEFERIANNLRG